ncbi:Ni/Fe-hydrogenase subunit HybB-like protein [Bartonella callosciuri]|uniref:Ni/Fe-hydrogenase subunit HybB-like protein n=1 Tax=Bartonella callosciuri TaxID=686223 RepID=A0A840NNQ8_9HYPH|nr:hypothetical protein [Bartonella callosciuri]MBB5074376.1 Ni/Fe-hydrogenase subunit HybB-like protein [Bartonella callosciuri]
MNIRYFFIACAVTSGLAVVLKESDSIVKQQPSPIIAPYTVDKPSLQLLEPTSGTFYNLHLLIGQNDISKDQEAKEYIFEQGKILLKAVFTFLYSIVVFYMQKYLMDTH